ncbi:MAG: tRNA (adenosine(37)-N6)-dimethylallyltransferase MiaA [Candidatus Yonathbacteria bacterium CG10_big_fil_rev_8_21_14_0_10_43_136]|uniref:tRNA dimethylallyltransferase n=2 Tax=Parcubacteria group TaxID=1794811 RepID=A0A2M7Q4W7_9BACT|nr:MAG: tRNA (adenosine(37)-N6)-dimethylallyltransferase MiaA [Candidatus Nomurabacteria bacterium CG2_30_43_9]PIR40878.1 MAG: tRNA (adenosine(37)-N6)-dimethylallyltransferase MiaA [Candidatus Yonathbacteria bacterium CG10_big_fil_rev_8_21_14_0_10_43_136]PIX57099.1 MAG: tRNA (adenosine(37)-N6)-dimethylallyltransferase MiaA [Candidatus Yonathbacteria bacterium CG_4_10_14_3_um_filter_43_12]PIY58477.1 MAG: tRNA (adenosine(37)-N6)-dimethylallyltransferase MiaA [Candidatus Yonathbacteria bacterium CG
MAHKQKERVIAVVGPTASGKSALAVKIARLVNGEIISADSRQVYTGLDIGTGKVTKREMKGVPHHLFDISNPKSTVSVVHYERLATRAVQDILKRGKVPILCGGTGQYIDAVLTSVSFPEVPPNAKLRKELEKLSAEKLFKKLQKMDPARAKTIDAKNPRRLIRAIEITASLGSVPARTPATERYNTLYIGLTLPKEELDARITARLRSRIKRGMVAEARKLHEQGLSWKRMESLGLEYRFLAQFLQKKTTKNEMLDLLEIAIRQYSKRQMVWFKRNKRIRWVEPKDRKIFTIVKTFLG